MDLDHLKRFYEVVRKGSFLAAAASLNVSQSALSRTIQILEEGIGVKLLLRTSKGVSPTPEGERLFEFASKIVQEAKIVERLLQDSSLEAQGPLKIITTPHMASDWLMDYIPSFLQKYPHLRIKVVGQHFGININEADVVIRTRIPHQPDLAHRHIIDFHMRLYASHKYLDRYGIPQKPEDLDQHQIIAFGDTEINPYRNSNWILTVGSQAGRTRDPYFEINSIEGLLNAAVAGLGIVELPAEFEKVKQAKLIEILPHIESPTVPVFYIYSKKFENSKRVTAFADYLEEQLKKRKI